MKANNIQIEETGSLYAVKPNSLEILKSKNRDPENLGMQEILDIPFQEINQLKIRMKGAIGKGAWIGVVFGLGFGVITGFIAYSADQYSDSGFKFDPITYIGGISLFTIPVFTGVGMAIGSKKHKIPIQTNPQLFRDNIVMLEEFTVVK